MEGDTYQMSHNIREAGRSFHELMKLHTLKQQPLITKMLAAIESLEVKMSPADIAKWTAQLQTLWEKVRPDVEAGSLPVRRTESLIGQLAPVADGHMPKHIPELELLDTSGGLIPTYRLKRSWQLLAHNEHQLLAKLPTALVSQIGHWPDTVMLAPPQYLLMQILAQGYERPQYASIFRQYYQATTELVILMEGIISAMFPGGVPEEGPGRLFYQDVPFFLTERTFGDKNQSHSYIAGVRDRVLQIQGLPGMTHLRPPFGYYPKPEAQTPPDFNPEDSPLFQIDGRRIAAEEWEDHQILGRELMTHLADREAVTQVEEEVQDATEQEAEAVVSDTAKDANTGKDANTAKDEVKSAKPGRAVRGRGDDEHWYTL
jgi:hypothetical protein